MTAHMGTAIPVLCVELSRGLLMPICLRERDAGGLLHAPMFMRDRDGITRHVFGLHVPRAAGQRRALPDSVKRRSPMCAHHLSFLVERLTRHLPKLRAQKLFYRDRP